MSIIREHPQSFFFETMARQLLVAIFYGGIVADLISVYLEHQGSDFWRLSLVVRALFFVVCVFLLLVVKRREGHEPLGVLLAGFGLSLSSLLYSYIFSPWFHLQDYLETILVMIKYVYVFFVYYLVKNIIDSAPRLEGIAKTLDISFGIYVFFIFLGLATGNDMFRSYVDIRPGYKGIIYAQNETTGFMLLAVLWFFVRAYEKRRAWFWLFVVTFASFVVGTKGLLIGVPVLLAALAVVSFRLGKAVFAMIFSGIAVFMAGEWAYQNLPAFNDAVGQFFGYMTYHFEHSDNDSLFALLISGRNEKVAYLINTVMTQSPWNLLIGGAPIGGYLSESDPVDISAAFGFPFLLLYAFLYWRMFFFEVAKRTWARRMLGMFFLVWIITAVAGGHILCSAVCAPFLACIVAYVQIRAPEFVDVFAGPPGGAVRR